MSTRRFSRYGDGVQGAVARSLYAKGREILKRSDELVPIDTGTLRASGRVLPPEVKADGTVEVTVSYGYGEEYEARVASEEGDDPGGPGYGVYVHERVELRHTPPRSAKFLEIAGLELLPTVPADVVVEIRRSWKPGLGAGDHVDVLGGEA